MQLRIGHIDYLNALPILFPLEVGLLGDDYALVKGTPAEINRRFHAGELDISLLSSIEYARVRDDCLILPNLSIAATGPVLSVLLFSRYLPQDLDGRHVALTSASATSSALTRLLFKRYWRVEPEFSVAAPNLEAMLAEADACLLMGDDALHAVTALKRGGGEVGGERIHVIDIGEAWQQHTAQPMVYAVWVVSREAAKLWGDKVQTFLRACEEAKRFSRAYRPHLIELAAASRRLDPTLVARYLQVIEHGLDDRLQHGLQTFYAEAVQAGELASAPPLRLFSTDGATVQAASVEESR